MIFFYLSQNVTYVTIPMTLLSIYNGKNMQKVENRLMDFMILHKCFHENHMVLNPGKCHYIVIGDTEPSYQIILNNNDIARSNKENKIPKT